MPLRAKFCSVQRLVVSRFDHHCPFVNNTIGAKNHKYFIGFLISAVVSISMWLVIACIYFSASVPGSNGFFVMMWVGNLTRNCPLPLWFPFPDADTTCLRMTGFQLLVLCLHCSIWSGFPVGFHIYVVLRRISGICLRTRSSRFCFLLFVSVFSLLFVINWHFVVDAQGCFSFSSCLWRKGSLHMSTSAIMGSASMTRARFRISLISSKLISLVRCWRFWKCVETFFYFLFLQVTRIPV